MDLVKSIFLGYMEDGCKEKFELERLFNTVNLISFEGLRYLCFFTKEIEVKWEKKIGEEMERLQWTRKQVETQESFSMHIGCWINENFDPNTDSVKKRWNYQEGDTEMLGRMYDKKRVHEEEFQERAAEYVSLSILVDSANASSGIGGSIIKSTYNLTDYGKIFLTFLKQT